MKHQLTVELLQNLKEAGYTILYAKGQGANDCYCYQPKKWDVDEFLNSSNFNNYDHHAIDLIDELLKLEEEYLLMHSVIISDEI